MNLGILATKVSWQQFFVRRFQMKVRELIALLQDVNPEAVVVVWDLIFPSRRRDFLGDYGFLPRVVCYEHDDGEIAVVGASEDHNSPSLEHRDHRYVPRRERGGYIPF